jgi:beta-xylosidase
LTYLLQTVFDTEKSYRTYHSDWPYFMEGRNFPVKQAKKPFSAFQKPIAAIP